MMNYIPVASDDIAPTAQAEPLTITSGPEALGEPSRFSRASVQEIALSEKVLGKLGLGAYAVRGGEEAYYFLLDVMLFENKSGTELHRMADGRFAFKLSGCGYRVLVVATRIEARFTGSLAGVTAAIRGGFGHATKHTFERGMILPNAEEIPFFKKQNTVDADFMKDLRQAIEALNAYLATVDDSELEPVPVGLATIGATPFTPANMAWSHRFGLEGLHKRRSLQEQITHLRGREDLRPLLLMGVVGEVYRHFGVHEATERPTDRHRQEAWRFLKLGRFGDWTKDPPGPLDPK